MYGGQVKPRKGADNDGVRAAFPAREEEITPAGMHGTMVAVDWDSCISQVS